jgi:hypothetical protein
MQQKKVCLLLLRSIRRQFRPLSPRKQDSQA